MSTITTIADFQIGRNIRLTRKRLTEGGKPIAYQAIVTVATIGPQGESTVKRKFICFHRLDIPQGWKYGKAKMTYRTNALKTMEEDIRAFVKLYSIR